MSITLVIPAKNEGGGIAELIASCRPYVNEIIVVDGHSSDDTIERSNGADKVILDNGLGKGDAYKVGVKAASCEVVVFIDADGSHDPADIPTLAAPILADEAELVVGSRIRGGSDELFGDFDNFIRAIGSGLITITLHYRFGLRITDALNGYRAINRKWFAELNLKCNDFDIEQHMISQCAKYGGRYFEVPTHEYCRKWGSSKLPTLKKGYLFIWRLMMDILPLK
jgi:dolichol-phosphate hexosyltransferase